MKQLFSEWYRGVIAKSPTSTQTPPWRTSTVSLVNQPPLGKCFPSWNSTASHEYADE